ncbi:MAG: DapH/DapD/GlmU-related protein [Lachnospiraceae bacterium]|nr:DapH/DapD/GlmU-related protein [Lachnospiraceae bacterium]
MNIRVFISRILGSENYDRKVERLIKKSIALYHRGGKINRIRALRLHNYIRKNYNCCVPPRVTVGKNLYIAHGRGVNIGKTAIIGDNCRIYPECDIIASIVGDSELRAQGATRWHAKIGNDCIIGAHSVIIGPIEIGDDVTIGAGAIVTKDVPPHSVVINTNQIRAKRPDERKTRAASRN